MLDQGAFRGAMGRPGGIENSLCLPFNFLFQTMPGDMRL
jgi:hypothetical protein